ALSSGEGMPPPGWCFDPGQQRGNGGWIGVGPPAASYRTRVVATLGGPFEREGKLGWATTPPAGLGPVTGRQERAFRSPLRLLEDGCGLSDGHHPHRAISAEGRGRYSFWGRSLYFSTSDGSDPNVNGHVYEIRTRIGEARPGDSRDSPSIDVPS